MVNLPSAPETAKQGLGATLMKALIQGWLLQRTGSMTSGVVKTWVRGALPMRAWEMSMRGVAGLVGHGVDVVHGGVGVAERDRAALLNGDDVRGVAAALLVEANGRSVRDGGVAGRSGLDVDVDVGEHAGR